MIYCCYVAKANNHSSCGITFSQVEYVLVKFDDKNKVARVSLRAQELLAILNQREADNPNGKT